jgi:hypothetical protein
MKRIILFINIFLIVNTILIYGQFERRQTNEDFNRTKVIEVEPINLPVFKLSKEDQQLIAPAEADKSRYADFLRLPDTEITKILNASCLEIGDVELSAGCKSGIPGYGRFYSFNHKRHLPSKLSNIQLVKGWFAATGFLTQGIIVSLGEVDIREISLQSEGVKFLAAFVPAETSSGAEKQAEKIKSGIEAFSFVYKQAEKVKENTVYAIRSISYRSKIKTASFDKRTDIIVIFKVLSREKDGSVVIIWRRLQSKDAPKIVEK